MKKKTIGILSTIVIIIGLIIIRCFVFHPKNETSAEENMNIQNNQEVINHIKNEINATGDTDFYQIEEEYDGRQVLQIKPNIQFETVLAGILKKGKPNEHEIPELLKNTPKQTGIWISEQSREKFLNLLQDNDIDAYAIDEEGYIYLKKEKKEISELTRVISAEKIYIIDISGLSYVRDEMSGEIVEYPFEKMEPYQILNRYNNENSIILEVTTNQKEKLSRQEILKEILQALES